MRIKSERKKRIQLFITKNGCKLVTMNVVTCIQFFVLQARPSESVDIVYSVHNAILYKRFSF